MIPRSCLTRGLSAPSIRHLAQLRQVNNLAFRKLANFRRRCARRLKSHGPSIKGRVKGTAVRGAEGVDFAGGREV
jgi:hypothetical protein